MTVITFINRFFIIGAIILSINGLASSGVYGAMGFMIMWAIPLGAFQVLASLILIAFREQMTEGLKWSLNTYYILVLFYLYLSNAMGEEISYISPVLLAIGITVIIELTYKKAKTENNNIN